jgi:hypothetical protein
VRKGWLTRLGGGRYLLLPPERGAENIGENNPLAVAAAVVKESYIGWWSAAAFHGFTTQQPVIIFVAVRRQVRPRTVEDTEIRFVTLTARKFFGFKSYSVYGRKTRISEPEKTLIDCVDRPDLPELSVMNMDCWRRPTRALLIAATCCPTVCEQTRGRIVFTAAIDATDAWLSELFSAHGSNQPIPPCGSSLMTTTN